MDMDLTFIYNNEGEEIPVFVTENGTTLLLESPNPQSFLNYVAGMKCFSSFPSNYYVRGFLTPDNGGSLQLFDRFGSPENKVIRLNEEEAFRLLLDIKG